MNLFKRRILGLASHFKDMETLMPKYKKSTDFHVVKIPMSDFQFKTYEEARVQERKIELRNARKRKKQQKNQLFEDTVSTYRIFSRAFCNFVFPKPDIIRPLPGKEQDIQSAILKSTIDEDTLDAPSVKEKLLNVDGRYTLDDIDELEKESGKSDYDEKVKAALVELSEKKTEFLTKEKLEIYSPKFLKMLDNIMADGNVGLHLIYSQFRTLEGIGILKLVLEANGLAMLKIVKQDGQWILDESDKDKDKPKFALYTGTETVEEKEIIRNIFNGTWEYLPSSLSKQLKEKASNNLLGEVVKLLMITASGAEGISLKNVRFVHITEPYWHPVRLEQVIGRARRICSHQSLPIELQTVKVFLYLMEFTKSQLENDDSIELRLKDKSRIDGITPVTSDQHLYEVAMAKADIANQLLQGIKEASIDCSLHAKPGDPDAPVCFTFGSPNEKKFAYKPAITEEESDEVSKLNKTTVKIKAVEVTIDGIKYAFDKNTGDVYDLDTYKTGNPVKVGVLKLEGTGKKAKYRYEPI